MLALCAAAVVGAVCTLLFNSQAAGWLWSTNQEVTWLLPLITVAALIDSVNPCACSILLVTLAFLFILGQLRAKVLAVDGLYLAGIFVVYAAIGLGPLQVLRLFETSHFMARVGAR